MIEALISLLIALAVLYVVYAVLTWILGKFPVPAIVLTILNIIFGVAAVVIVLRFLGTFFNVL
jgi:hypothetical protein